MKLLRNYKCEYGTSDRYPWYIPNYNKPNIPNMIWYFATYSYSVQIEDDINTDSIWDGWKISKVSIGYSLSKD